MISRIFLVVLAVQWSLGQQLHSYLAQQQQQQQHPQQQYRLIPAQPQRLQVQPQYATEEDGSSGGQAQYRAPQQYQLQQLQYRQPQAGGHLLRPAAGAEQPEQEQLPEDYDPNPQYQFGFDVKDDQYTNYQNRKEQREGDKITGSYSVVDSDGFIRTVTYTADPKEGFKAEVTRTPTDIVVKLPTPPPPQQLQQLSGRQPHPQRLQAVREPQPQQYLRQSAPAAQQYVQLTPAQLQHYGLLAAQQKQHLDGAAAASTSSSSSAAAGAQQAQRYSSSAAGAQQAQRYSAAAAQQAQRYSSQPEYQQQAYHLPANLYRQ